MNFTEICGFHRTKEKIIYVFDGPPIDGNGCESRKKKQQTLNREKEINSGLSVEKYQSNQTILTDFKHNYRVLFSVDWIHFIVFFFLFYKTENCPIL